MSDTITLTHAELAEIIARAVATALSTQQAQKSRAPADRQKRYRERVKASQTATTVTRDVTSDVVENIPPMVPPLPLLSPALAHTREALENLDRSQPLPAKPTKASRTRAADWKAKAAAEADQANAVLLPMLDAPDSFKTAWGHWCQHRKRIATEPRIPSEATAWTIHTASLLLDRIAKLVPVHGWEVISERLLLAVESGWKGPHFDKLNEPVRVSGPPQSRFSKPAPKMFNATVEADGSIISSGYHSAIQ